MRQHFYSAMVHQYLINTVVISAREGRCPLISDVHISIQHPFTKRGDGYLILLPVIIRKHCGMVRHLLRSIRLIAVEWSISIEFCGDWSLSLKGRNLPYTVISWSHCVWYLCGMKWQLRIVLRRYWLSRIVYRFIWASFGDRLHWKGSIHFYYSWYMNTQFISRIVSALVERHVR